MMMMPGNMGKHSLKSDILIPFRSFRGEIVKLLVGPNEKSFKIH